MRCSHVINVPTVGPVLATMIGLGVGIDYALFIVTRHRQQMGEGMEPRESAARAVATAGGAVLFAGTTVVIALCSLALAGIPIVSALGYTAAIAVVVAVLAAITLMPALLGILGHRVESLRACPSRIASPTRAVSPRLDALGTLDLPPPVAGPRRQPHLPGRLGHSDAPPAPGRHGCRASCRRPPPRGRPHDLLTKGFGPGVNGPFLIAVDLQQKAKPDQKALDKIDRQKQKLQKQLADAKAQTRRRHRCARGAGFRRRPRRSSPMPSSR